MNFRFTHRFWLILTLSIISIWGALDERTPFNNGLGWDGKNYAYLTSTFEEMAVHKQIDSYQYQRIFTPVVVYYASQALHIPLSAENIPYVFRVFNLLLIACTVWLFFKLCSHYQLKSQTEVIGFSALFFNYFILKNTPYYPILTDISGFWIGFALCYFFLMRKKAALLLTAFLGHFTFPLVLLTSIPLHFDIRNNRILKWMQSSKMLGLITLLGMLLLFSLIALVLFLPSILDPHYTMHIQLYVLPVSILWVMIYLWKISMTFHSAENKEGAISWKYSLAMVLGIVGFIIVTNYAIAQISIPEDRFTPQVFVFNIVQQCISLPLISLISHTIYFGPAVLLMVVFFKQFIRTIKQQGDSAVVYFIIIAVLCLGSESRQFVPYYPFLVMMLMLALNSFSFSRYQVMLFVLLSLVSSKCWFKINVPGIFSKYDFGNFPDQRYFMHHGPFMSQTSYLINLGIVVILGLCCYFIFRKTETSHTNVTDSTIPS
ncbi:MAG: hypothetical protein V4590_13685 [Bacteroidota bacterium]